MTILVVLAVGACASEPNPRVAEPTELPEQPVAPSQEVAPEATIAAPTAESVGPKTCHEFIGNSSVEQWREQLIAAVSQRDDARTTEVARCVDPNFNLSLFDQVEEWLVVANPRQLDADADEEWVLELRQHTPITGDGERFDLVWLAVLDWSEPRYKLAGVVSRAKIHACLMADDLGLATEFTSDEPSADAAMVITEQHTKSCDKQLDVSYSRTQHRVVDGKLVSEPLTSPKPKRYTR